MKIRHKLERESGTKYSDPNPSAEMKALNKQFGMLHGISSLIVSRLVLLPGLWLISSVIESRFRLQRMLAYFLYRPIRLCINRIVDRIEGRPARKMHCSLLNSLPLLSLPTLDLCPFCPEYLRPSKV